MVAGEDVGRQICTGQVPEVARSRRVWPSDGDEDVTAHWTVSVTPGLGEPELILPPDMGVIAEVAIFALQRAVETPASGMWVVECSARTTPVSIRAAPPTISRVRVSPRKTTANPTATTGTA